MELYECFLDCGDADLSVSLASVANSGRKQLTTLKKGKQRVVLGINSLLSILPPTARGSGVPILSRSEGGAMIMMAKTWPSGGSWPNGNRQTFLSRSMAM